MKDSIVKVRDCVNFKIMCTLGTWSDIEGLAFICRESLALKAAVESYRRRQVEENIGVEMRVRWKRVA